MLWILKTFIFGWHSCKLFLLFFILAINFRLTLLKLWNIDSIIFANNYAKDYCEVSAKFLENNTKLYVTHGTLSKPCMALHVSYIFSFDWLNWGEVQLIDVMNPLLVIYWEIKHRVVFANIKNLLLEKRIIRTFSRLLPFILTPLRDSQPSC